MTRRYGRVAGGQRLNDSTPVSWRSLTILGAVGLGGWQAMMTIEAATDTDVFQTFLDHVLCPKLKPGEVVVMDNLAAHKVAGVGEKIRATGARLLYLPPYSPDFNPIEKCWAQLKQHLRAAKARTIPVLEQALTAALTALTPDQAAACFRHCGYGA
jgi:transposase